LQEHTSIQKNWYETNQNTKNDGYSRTLELLLLLILIRVHTRQTRSATKKRWIKSRIQGRYSTDPPQKFDKTQGPQKKPDNAPS
jgi:hypothetical protein